ncbi:MAG: response regulator transcription factor [Lachnospiraceae bacterium]|nr:response regulator transcription factor [Lachnospiraceae bacterium]
MVNILLIEDDLGLNKGLAFDLENEGYNVYTAASIKEGNNLFSTKKIGLVITDGNLPDGDGFAFCKNIKYEYKIPVIILTVRNMVNDELAGFEAGADDYITKPFQLSVLYKRIQVALRNYGITKRKMIFDDGRLIVDFDKLKASIDNMPVELTAKEFKILNILISNENSVVTKSRLLEKVWDNEGKYVDEHVVAVNINRLRGKLENGNFKYIKTMYGVGYLWKPERQE